MFVTLFAAAALAHMALEEPLPRYPSDGGADNKACPCGVGDSNRLCDDPTDRSDPDRSTDVQTYAPGETITLRWRETIGHAGRWRIAFDADGADMDDFNDTILLDIADPSGSAGNMGGDLWEVQITVPTTPCDNCTLQLVQIMDGNTSDPVQDPVGRSSYYQCADIIIAGASDDPEGPTADTATPGESDDADPQDGGAGCGCSAIRPGGSWLVGALGVLVMSRRRRRAWSD